MTTLAQLSEATIKTGGKALRVLAMCICGIFTTRPGRGGWRGR